MASYNARINLDLAVGKAFSDIASIEKKIQNLRKLGKSIELTGKTDIRQAQRSFNVLSRSVKGATNVVKGLGTVLKSITNNFRTLAPAVAGVELLNFANNFQKLQSPITQTAAALAKATNGALEFTAANAPLVAGVAAGTTVLAAFGPQVATVASRLLKLGAAAGRSKLSLQELVNTYSEVSGAFDDAFGDFDLSIQQRVVEQYRQKLFEVSETVSELGRRKTSLQTALDGFNSRSATAEKIATKLVNVNARLNDELREQADLLRRVSGVTVTELEAAKGRKSIQTRKAAATLRGDQYNRAVEVRKSWDEFFKAANRVALDLKAQADKQQQEAANLKQQAFMRRREVQSSWDNFFLEAKNLAEDLRMKASRVALQAAERKIFVQETISRGKSARLARENSARVLAREKLLRGESGPVQLGPLANPGASPFRVAIRLSELEQKGVNAANEKLKIRQRILKNRKEYNASMREGLRILDQAAARDIAIEKGERVRRDRAVEISKQGTLARGLFSNIEGRRPDGTLIPGSPLFKQQRSRQLKEAGANALIGGAFPLLFGQGPGGAAGGAVGGAAGGLVGGPYGLALSLAGSAVGAQVDALITQLNDLAGSLSKPSEGLAALEAAGLKVSDSTKKQIEGLLEVGRVYDAQTVLFDEIRKRLGEEGVRDLTALADAQDRLSDSFADAKAQIMEEVLPALVAFTGGLSRVVEEANKLGITKQLPKAAAVATLGPFAGIPIAVMDIMEGFGIKAGGDNRGKNPDRTKLQEQQQVALDLAQSRVNLLNNERTLLADKSSLLDDITYKNAQDLIVQEKQAKLNALALESEFDQVQQAEILLAADRALLNLAKDRAAEEEKVLQKRMRIVNETANARVVGIDREITLLDTAANIEKVRLGVALNKAAAAKDYAKVYDIQIQLAKIDFDLSTKRIESEVKKLSVSYELLQAQKAIVQAAILENEANGQLVGQLKEELSLLDVKVKQAKASLEFGEELAKEQLKQAEAVRVAAEESAQMQLNQSLMAEASAAAAQSSAAQANSSAVTASNAEQTANALQRQTQQLEKQAAIKTKTSTATFQLTSQLMDLERGDRTFANPAEQIEFFREAEKPFVELKQKSEALSQAQDLQAQATEAASLGMDRLAQKLERYAEQIARAGNVLNQFKEIKSEQFEGATSSSGELTPFAEGGYVDRPTKALIGEAGPEYVIREDQMKEALVRYASGKRGEEVTASGSTSPNISIKTGPVMQVGGQDYISRADFERGMKEMSASLLTTIRRSPSTRSRLGI